MSKILIYQHNNVMNGSLIQLPITVNWRPSETGEIEYMNEFIKCS